MSLTDNLYSFISVLSVRACATNSDIKGCGDADSTIKANRAIVGGKEVVFIRHDIAV